MDSLLPIPLEEIRAFLADSDLDSARARLREHETLLNQRKPGIKRRFSPFGN